MKARPITWIRKSCILWLFILLITGCEKKEKLIPPPPDDALSGKSLLGQCYYIVPAN
jgi:hypothetical protein